MLEQDPTISRLEDQIEWYDRKSMQSQRWFKSLKGAEVALAAIIPLAAGLGANGLITGGLGVAIVIAEGLQQMNQYHLNWITFRSTCEALKHEKFLYLGKAGDYAAANNPHALLAEKLEGLISQEHAKWTSGREQAAKGKVGTKPIQE